MADLALTTDERQQLIIAELDPAGAAGVAALIDLYWRKFRAAGQVSVELQDLLTRQALENLVLRAYAEKRDWQAAGVSQKDSQVYDHLKDLFAGLPGLITAEKMRLAAQAGMGAIGEITQKTPIQVTDGTSPDPNERALRGDPLRRFPSSERTPGWP